MKLMILAAATLFTFTACNNASTDKTVTDTVRKAPAVQAEPSPAPEPERNPPVTENSAASALPAFKMLNAAGQTIDLAQYKGKKIFVNLWATWCPPCRAEIPSIESLAAKTDRNKVEFVMLSLDDNFEKAKNYAARNGMKLPVYYPAATLPPLFTVDGIPVTYIFNEKGEIIFQQMGSLNYDSEKFVEMLNS
ncbi:MAG: TlpA family protein disulfide reductase [Chitinophagaceae bacterium]|nr:TlpA family protein disulfide reductase [Chitinophagaceae bacterium]